MFKGESWWSGSLVALDTLFPSALTSYQPEVFC